MHVIVWLLLLHHKINGLTSQKTRNFLIFVGQMGHNCQICKQFNFDKQLLVQSFIHEVFITQLKTFCCAKNYVHVWKYSVHHLLVFIVCPHLPFYLFYFSLPYDGFNILTPLLCMVPWQGHNNTMCSSHGPMYSPIQHGQIVCNSI